MELLLISAKRSSASGPPAFDASKNGRSCRQANANNRVQSGPGMRDQVYGAACVTILSFQLEAKSWSTYYLTISTANSSSKFRKYIM